MYAIKLAITYENEIEGLLKYLRQGNITEKNIRQKPQYDKIGKGGLKFLGVLPQKKVLNIQ